MRQSSTAQPPTQTTLLHPVLHNALANLDFQLEEELARYRRQRATGGRTRRSASRKPATKTLDLISISATVPATASPAQPSEKGNSISEARVDRPAASVPTQGYESAPTQPPVATAATAVNQAGSPLAISTQAPADSLVPEHDPGAEPFSTTGASQETLTQVEEELDDYLESSEELLRSLAEEEAKVQAERGFMKNLLTPLGFGSMLLLLLSSAMFGYIVMNPSSFSRWMASREAATPTNSSSPPATAPNLAQPGSEDLPQPNLAAREFKDLNLDTLGTLKANSSASKLPKPPGSSAATGKPAASSTNLGVSGRLSTATTSPPQRPVIPAAPVVEPRPAAPEIESAPPPSDPVSSYVPPAPQVREEAPPPPAPERSYVPPAEPYETAPPPAASAEPAPPASPAASAQAYPYKLVTPYQGDPSLDSAQKAEPGAFLTDNGAKIQVGAFSDSSAAESRAEELRQQGISVEVQKR